MNRSNAHRLGVNERQIHIDVTPEEFLKVSTPRTWLETAVTNEEVLLIDHAHCERKAANSALSLIHRHAKNAHLCLRLSRIVREEMRHFELVLKLIESRGHLFRPLSPSRYAGRLHTFAQCLPGKSESDPFIVAAMIEARSCERFRSLVHILEPSVANLYARLCESEERHFLLYLEMAHEIESNNEVGPRLSRFLDEEERLVTSKDDRFRFHSGIP